MATSSKAPLLSELLLMLISNEAVFGMTNISSVSMIAPGTSSQIRVHGLNAFQTMTWHLMHIDTLFHSFV